MNTTGRYAHGKRQAVVTALMAEQAPCGRRYLSSGERNEDAA
jgi:hypothetical protein